ncbi:MAG: ABC transporter permease [Chloroflexota bacterium]|nr:ABC transporter permease [Chloroflexota bacterium]
MSTYVIRRLLLAVPTFIGITIVVFGAVRFLPGDVVDQMLGDYGALSPELRQQLREQYSLNESIPKQYVEWVGRIARGDLGTSIVSGREVVSELKTRVPATVELGVLGLLCSIAVAIPVGVISAVKQDTLVDAVARSGAIIFLSVPSFWLGLLTITYGFQWFGWAPPIQFHQFWESPSENLGIVVIPAVILGTGLAATTMRLTRSTMLEVLREDYIRTARAKGLRDRAVIWRHALRNAVIPVITAIGLQIPVIIGGTVILERIFSIPGMGSYLLTSLSLRDYPVVQAIVLLSATVVLVTNLVVDLSYTLLDPRVSYK